MNYRHGYHAGNFCDVFKHVVLIELINALKQKDKPFCVLDTHAGCGLYDLKSEAAQKSREYISGIAKIFPAENPPEAITTYIECVRSFQRDDALRYYPGSPLIANYFLRRQDRLLLSELHPEEFLFLKKNIGNKRNVFLHRQDAYQSLKAFLPFKEHRGLILIDPPYEKPDEIAQLQKGLEAALKRFETGVFAIWYPIKDRSPLVQLQKSLREKFQREMLVAELCIYPETPARLNGNGMLIINPPWKLDIALEKTTRWLHETLATKGQGNYSMSLVG